MTLPVTNRIAGPYSCNGTVAAFDFVFKVFTTADIRVVKTSAVGVETVLVLDSDYTVVLNADQENDPGGTVTTSTVFATGFTVTIDGALAYGQTAELTNLGTFFPKVIEAALDRLAILIQQLKRLMDRSLKLAVSDTISSTELPSAAQRANRVLGFDANGDLATHAVSVTVYGTIVEEFVATVGQTVFNLSNSYVPGINAVAVFLNGLRLRGGGVDFTETTATRITLVIGAALNDEVVVVLGQETTGVGSLDASVVSYSPAGVGAAATNVQAKLRESVSVKDFGAVGDGVTDDTAAIQAAMTYVATLAAAIPADAGNQYSGVVLEFAPGSRHKISSVLTFPSRCHVKGNNAAIFASTAIVLANVYGWESKISDLRFYNGTKAVNYTQGNVDKSTAVIENCSFSGQTSLVIDSTGTNSTHLQIKDCKFVTSVPILYSECDEVSISGGWVTASGIEVSYFTTLGHLSMEDVLLVPSLTGTATQKLDTYWIQCGKSADKRGNVSCRRVRFGGESTCSYLLNYAKANSTALGILRKIDIQNCELWATGYFEFLEIPNSLVIVDNHFSVSGETKLIAAAAGAVSATANMTLWQIDPEILYDETAGLYVLRDLQGSGGGKNLIATNSYFDGFALTAELGTAGSSALLADTWPKNNIRAYTFGTIGAVAQLYFVYSLSTGLAGLHTLSFVASSTKNVTIQVGIGAFIYRIPIIGDGKLRQYTAQGVLTAAYSTVLVACYYVPDGTVVEIGHPSLLTGNTKALDLIPAISTTTLTLSIYEGKYFASAAPSDGYWYKGQKIYHIAPAASGNMGWVCTASGAPGTWKTFGAVAA